jgi:hypothetical protein
MVSAAGQAASLRNSAALTYIHTSLCSTVISVSMTRMLGSLRTMHIALRWRLLSTKQLLLGCGCKGRVGK